MSPDRAAAPVEIVAHTDGPATGSHDRADESSPGTIAASVRLILCHLVALSPGLALRMNPVMSTTT